ncbi:hypothetical protein LTR78_005973 [Recurvomyces mirabilis]|uniref:FAD-binding PCMH-type domain-containing protein n=1 Tax=Recurvomyces mirabilis TaxID=574656 RepID=A0AAE1C0S7_9PEZI|nr:hypothetical protein LTR78_005973 [Recurvomyces mirabilis]KAK5155216.1 hypothetical protein LTS14_006171 [Recurvomyces mirabilis]
MARERRTVNQSDVDELRRLLSGTQAHVLTSSDPGYGASIERWSLAAVKPAGVSILPSSSEEVAIAIKYASSHYLDVAVKGGGHSTAGASSSDGGLLIDLGRMRKVEVDVEKQQLHVQGGCIWADVDEAAWQHKLATVGGTVADTGVGGLTLGGGYGHLSGSRGLVIDNTISITTVTADGTIVRASKTENTDLFWALNGAGQNFGVTTEFVLRAYRQEEVYAGTLVFPPSPDVISKLVTIVNDLYYVPGEGTPTKTKGQLNSLLAIGRPPDAGGQTVTLFIFAFDGNETQAKKLLQPIYTLGPLVDMTSMKSYPEVNKQIPTAPGFRSSMKGAAFVLPIREEFVHTLLSKYNTFLDSQPDAQGSLLAWELYDPTIVVASDEGCFANRGYHLNSLIMPLWSKAENDKECRQFARDLSLEFKHELERKGERTGDGVEGGASVRGKKNAVLLYGNYDQYDEKSRDIFGDNYPRLQEIKARYDPDNMFDKLFAIQPSGAGTNGA